MKKLVIITLLLCLYGLRGKTQETEWQWRVETHLRPNRWSVPSICIANERTVCHLTRLTDGLNTVN